MDKKTLFPLLSAVIMLFLALVSTFQMLESVRLVTLITVFSGAFGSGASLVSAIYNYRISKAKIDKI